MCWYGVLTALVAAAGAAGAQRPEVAVSAAASLTDVLQQVADVYEGRFGERVVLNVGASNTLARQIAAGARVDVFVSADEAQMDGVSRYIDPASRVALVSNQLAIVVPADRPRRFASARELADPAVRRIALGDPAAVPAGVYAKAYLQALGVWDALASKIVPVGSVRLALAAVEHGAVDAAVVYRTDIGHTRRVRAALVVPAQEGPRIVYPAAMVRDAPNPAGARRFIAFLQTADAAAVFARAGFLRP